MYVRFYFIVIKRFILPQNAMLIAIYFRVEAVYSLYQDNNPPVEMF